MMLIKSVLSSIPFYTMFFLPLPKTVENQLLSTLCGLLWGGNEMTKKVAWIKWDEVCKSTREGGLSIKNLLLFNKALLNKWVWRFLNEKQNLWVKVISSKFGDLQWGRYGKDNKGRRRKRTGWWKKVVEGVEGREGGWFWEKIE